MFTLKVFEINGRRTLKQTFGNINSFKTYCRGLEFAEIADELTNNPHLEKITRTYKNLGLKIVLERSFNFGLLVAWTLKEFHA